jgi:hypothetical protein
MKFFTKTAFAVSVMLLTAAFSPVSSYSDSSDELNDKQAALVPLVVDYTFNIQEPVCIQQDSSEEKNCCCCCLFCGCCCGRDSDFSLTAIRDFFEAICGK